MKATTLLPITQGPKKQHTHIRLRWAARLLNLLLLLAFVHNIPQAQAEESILTPTLGQNKARSSKRKGTEAPKAPKSPKARKASKSPKTSKASRATEAPKPKVTKPDEPDDEPIIVSSTPRRKKRRRKIPLRVVHTPPYEADPDGNLELRAEVQGEWKARKIEVHYRVRRALVYHKTAFVRGQKSLYYASIDKRNIIVPGLEYYIVSTDHKGRKQLHFGSPRRPHVIQVRRSGAMAAYLARLERHQGLRSSLGLFFSLHYFNDHTGLKQDSSPPSEGPPPASDIFYRMELWYTYRVLGFFYQISLGYGRLRGDVPLAQTSPQGDPIEPQLYRSGLDYGMTKIFLEFHRYFGVEAKLILGASERGFEGGAGAIMRIGNLVETHLDLGFEAISRIGFSVFMEFVWDTVPNLLLSLRAEVSNMPFFDQKSLATKAYVKALWKAHRHFHLFLHVGYARRISTPSGGPVANLGVIANF